LVLWRTFRKLNSSSTDFRRSPLEPPGVVPSRREMLRHSVALVGRGNRRRRETGGVARGRALYPCSGDNEPVLHD